MNNLSLYFHQLVVPKALGEGLRRLGFFILYFSVITKIPKVFFFLNMCQIDE